MKKIVKLFLVLACVLGLFIVWFGVVGINKTIDKTVSVEVYENNGETNKDSSITISGNVKKTLFSSEYSFVGTFAIDYYEPSCRDGIEAKIKWYDEDYQDITFFYAGDTSHFDIKKIEINEEMDSMMILLNDGTIIATKGYDIPGNTGM